MVDSHHQFDVLFSLLIVVSAIATRTPIPSSRYQDPWYLLHAISTTTHHPPPTTNHRRLQGTTTTAITTKTTAPVPSHRWHTIASTLLYSTLPTATPSPAHHRSCSSIHPSIHPPHAHGHRIATPRLPTPALASHPHAATLLGHPDAFPACRPRHFASSLACAAPKSATTLCAFGLCPPPPLASTAHRPPPNSSAHCPHTSTPPGPSLCDPPHRTGTPCGPRSPPLCPHSWPFDLAVPRCTTRHTTM